MNGLLRYNYNILVIFIIFFTLFPVNFIFLPDGLSTRVIIAFLGIIQIAVSSIKKNKINIDKNIIKILGYTSLLCIWSYLCMGVFNYTYDITYVKHIYTISIMLLSTNFCIKLISRKYILDFDVIAKFYIAVILLQSFFTLLIFLSPSFSSFLFGIQRLGERETMIISAHLEGLTRFIGFGVMFYNASFFFGIALIFIAYLLRENKTSKKGLLIFLYLFITIVGIGLSRSTIIGLFISLFIYLYSSSLNISLIRKIIGFIFSMIALILLIKFSFVAFPEIEDNYGALINNSFEVFVNLASESEIKSESASATLSTFKLPQEEWTYFFGTGFYEQYYSIGDFSYSDIGYLRLLYYFGIGGLLLFFLLEIKILQYSFYNKGYKLIFWGLITLLIITNIKGLTTLAIISLLFIQINPKLNYKI